MKISELFYSIQGEGKRSGVPSFFIRTNFCNLRCRFPGGNLCDTSYTSWYPDDKKNLGETDIGFIIKEFKKVNCSDVVITGGEPTMYPDELESLCRQIKEIDSNIFITIETNGTCFGSFVDHANLMSISPKLKSSVPFKTNYEKMHEKNRIDKTVLRKFNSYKVMGKVDVQWKFVFTSAKDIAEIKKLRKGIGFRNDEIYLMPEGTTVKDLMDNRVKTIDACLKNDFNFTDRIHILAWGNVRGK